MTHQLTSSDNFENCIKKMSLDDNGNGSKHENHLSSSSASISSASFDLNSHNMDSNPNNIEKANDFNNNNTDRFEATKKLTTSSDEKENANSRGGHFITSDKEAPMLANTSESIKYGELIVLGYNGCIGNGTSSGHNQFVNSSRRKSKFILKSRDKPNGVKPATQHVLQTSQEVDNLINKNPNHSVTYTLSRNQTVVVQYIKDEKTDMFQIGRSSESAIDFIVLDTVVPSSQSSSSNAAVLSTAANKSNSQQAAPNPANNSNQQSTISRFSCRITVDREYPYTARIYAAGFDSSKRIFLGEKATKWKNDKGELDGVTTNGVLIMHPTNGFTDPDSKSSEWMEVSVCGAVFSLNESRLSPCINNKSSCASKASSAKSNILRDGTLIDLCGATLLWRSTESLKKTPGKHYLDMNLEHLNRLRPQCPVGLKTLVFPSTASPNALPSAILAANNLNSPLFDPHLNQHTRNLASNLSKHLADRIPMVYLKCGHVHGHHDWGVKKDNERECPLCRKVGPYVQLLIGLEPSLYNDTELNNSNNNINLFRPFAFRPCGHMASEKSCKYWSRMLVPQGTTQGLACVCPFCAIPLCKEQPYVKLIFQEGV